MPSLLANDEYGTGSRAAHPLSGRAQKGGPHPRLSTVSQDHQIKLACAYVIENGTDRMACTDLALHRHSGLLRQAQSLVEVLLGRVVGKCIPLFDLVDGPCI